MVDGKKKMKSNTEDEYNKALVCDDPTKISKETQEKLVRDAIKKFKSL
jgi:creatinine amidohydrolase/Fe(II)-dependent formamide hydrolase-like protein